MQMAARGIVFLLIVGHLGGAGASNLRSQDAVNKTGSGGPDEIPDPSCKKGIVSPDLKACCASGCGNCGNHKLCGDIGKYHEATGKLADQCCKDRILKKAPSCDKDHPPCVLSPSYKENLNKYVIDRPKRHALDDCNKAVSISRSKNALGIEKGEFFTKLAVEGTTKYQDAKALAIKVRGLCEAKTRQSKELVARYSQKVSSANAEDKKKDALSGVSQVMQWEDKRDNEKAEVKFYNMIIQNSKDVEKAANKGLGKVKSLKAEVQPFKVKDLSGFHVKLNALTDDALLVYKDAELLWKQWKDASKDYNCGAPPAVGRVKSQCDKGNTKFSPKCAITCLVGYDGKGTQNALRCNRQGKFGKQLYGEWQGMASCMPRNCGKPEKISKAKTVIQDIMYPHAAAYVCYEGFSTDRKPNGPKAFSVSCDATGGFVPNSNQCKAITCGGAPVVKNADVSAEKFFYTQLATYKCQEGHTVDETAGGLKSFQVSCQATGQFSAGLSCRPVRCGPAPDFANTELLDAKGDRFFGDKLEYKCEAGYTLDQKPKGPASYTLVCPAAGAFAVPGAAGDSPLPKCRPMSAGVAAKVKHGKFNPREMFYGESVLITANTGYSISGRPGQGTSFTLEVTSLGQYSGMQIFIPVVCGPTPSVAQATTDFKAAKVVYGDVLNYQCKDGYSTDKTNAKGAKIFSIQCDADADLSQIPGYGKCANINDCAGITCGPKGTCVDHLMNYTCSCESGYEQRMDTQKNELTCGNIDDCGPEACGVGECVDGVNDYKCTCPKGYEQIDSDDGKDHTCQRVLCGTPPEIDSAVTSPTELQVQKASYQDQIVYQCDEGHTTNAKASGKNHFEIECLATESFTAAKACKPIQCNNVPVVFNGKAPGYQAPAPKKMPSPVICAAGEGDTCSCSGTVYYGRKFANGKPGRGKLMTFEAMKSAGTRRKIVSGSAKCANSNMPGSDPAYGFYKHCYCEAAPPAKKAEKTAVFNQSVRFDCQNGYTVDGTATGDRGFTVTCQKDGNFGEPQECKPVTCGEPDNVAFASRASGTMVYKNSVTYTCFKGYTLSGERDAKTSWKLECKSDGKFTKMQQCLPKICGKPHLNINVLYASTKDEGVIRYPMNTEVMCRDGYTVGGSGKGASTFTVRCTSEGVFEKYDARSCDPVRCGPPPAMANATLENIDSPNGRLGGTNDAKAKNLEACIGECDNDAQCKPGLKCFQRTGLTPVPGCTGSGKKDWDYCYDPTGSIALSGGNDNNAKNLRACRGECDKDSQCASGLKCFQRSNGETIPGCSGAGSGKTWDYCYDPKIQTPTPAGPLKTKYDARCFDYNHNNQNVYMHPCHNGNNQQWYFDNAGRLKTKDASYCLDYNTNNKNVYMHKCHHGKNQEWYFDNAGRLKTKHDDNCLDYNYGNKNVYMHKCHDGKNQKWYFDGKSQLGAINYEEKAVYKCNTGFTTGGEYNAPTNFNVECLPSGELSAPTPENQCRNVNDCEQHTCGKKGQCVDLIGPSPAYTCKCDHGYEIQTDSSGEKTCGNKDDCEGRGCGVGTCKDLIGDYTCICPSGHYIGVKDGQKTCVPVQCESSTPSLSNGRLLSSHSGAVDFPTTLRYKCATGYSVDGTVSESMRKFQAQCKPHGQLVGMSSCQKISCGTAHVVPFTTLLLPSSQRKSIEYDDKAKYKCITGYTVGGKVGASVNFEVKCQDSGSLTDPKVCEPVKCGSPPSMPKSRPSIAGNAFYGQNLMYNCDVGYSLDGTPRGSTQFQRHCKIDGSFSATSETCKPMSAGPAPTITHATMSEYAGRSVTTFPPQVYYPNGLEYRCNAGYSTTGSSTAPTKITARVNSIGTFSPALATACKLIVFQMRSKIKSARSGASLNGVTVRIEGTSNTATTQNGFFTLRNLRAGNVNVVYEMSGYITVRKALSITGNINSGGIGDVSMSPAMRNDEWRAVLKWGASPRDPDSYAMWGSNKVYYGNKRVGGGGNKPLAVLEQDITSGFGPETVYFSNLGKCKTPTPTGPLTTNHDARCLDYNYNNKNVYMHQCHNGNNQKWYFDNAGRLKSKHDGKCLDYNYNNKNVFMHRCHDGKNQQWKLTDKTNQGVCDIQYKIKNVAASVDAEVTLFTGLRTAGTWKITDCPRSVSSGGSWWHVFTLDAKTNRVKWSCSMPELGGTNDGNARNLEACIGECDSDAQCKSGLKCFQRNGLARVPGCYGSGKNDWDYCYDPTGTTPLSGGNNNNARNLQACVGECDSDSQCASGLKCFQRSNGETIPGCSGAGSGKGWDYCYDPNTGAALIQTTDFNHTSAPISTNQTMPITEKHNLPGNIRR